MAVELSPSCPCSLRAGLLFSALARSLLSLAFPTRHTNTIRGLTGLLLDYLEHPRPLLHSMIVPSVSVHLLVNSRYTCSVFHQVSARSARNRRHCQPKALHIQLHGFFVESETKSQSH
ncbi:hypothetical protein EDB19DRAFT_1673658 [Suillus lakei]|nr:hypothetical protein EDB19DRAFT_1673658 [Suillus lakei]